MDNQNRDAQLDQKKLKNRDAQNIDI